MDKDNLGIQRFFSRPTNERIESVWSEVQQQMLTAFFLMIVGLLLAAVGFFGIILRLVRLAGFSVLVLAQHIGLVRHVDSEIARRHFPGNRRRTEVR